MGDTGESETLGVNDRDTIDVDGVLDTGVRETDGLDDCEMREGEGEYVTP